MNGELVVKMTSRIKKFFFFRLGVILVLLLSVVALSAWGFSEFKNKSVQTVGDTDRLRSIDSERVSPETWRSIQLSMYKADGSLVSINLLRPLWWLEEANAREGGTIFLSMPEMGVEGDADVLEIGPCPVAADTGESGQQIVTGTFCHQNAVVLDLYFDHSTEPLSTTANHPLWSASREDWVEAGELELGEYVATKDGVVQLTLFSQRPGRHKVYNLEVHKTHNYYVSNLGILVHNSCAGKGGGSPKRTKQGGAITEPDLPAKTIASDGDVEISHYTRSGDHGPAHLHVKGGGPETKIGQAGKPLDGASELTSSQKKVVEANKAKVRKSVDQIQRWKRFEDAQ